jgi:hypothetical protein
MMTKKLWLGFLAITVISFSILLYFGYKIYFQVGEQKQVCNSDISVESPANIVHCISNEYETLARILVVNAPCPAQKTTLLKKACLTEK